MNIRHDHIRGKSRTVGNIVDPSADTLHPLHTFRMAKYVVSLVFEMREL
jgi:hypothetical protein